MAHQVMVLHSENMVAQGECGGIERIWRLRGEVMAHQGMVLHSENMVARGNVVA